MLASVCRCSARRGSTRPWPPASSVTVEETPVNYGAYVYAISISSGVVRTSKVIRSELSAREVQIFCPFTT